MDDNFIPPVGGGSLSSSPSESASPPPFPSTGGSASQGSDPMDPTGVWTRFLSTPGHPATEKQVEQFIGGLLRQLGNQIQRELQRSQKAAQRMKRAIEGD